MSPKVLIATTNRWFTTARLAMALANAGFAVEGLCPPRHSFHRTNAVGKVYTYRGLTPLASFTEAIAAATPDLIVSGDDLATNHLYDVYRRERRRGKRGAQVAGLIEQSLGAPESFPLMYTRTALLELARTEGIRAPKSIVITSADDLKKWTFENGLPAVLKADGTCGGEGVRIVYTLEEVVRAYRMLQAPPLFARAAKRALMNQDKTLVWPSLLRRRGVVNAQTFIAGHEATSMIACWKGSVLASLHFEVLEKKDPAGSATVLRAIDNAEMSRAAQKLARKLGLSGLHGLDFMIEVESGKAFLIEVNPRAAQIGHLVLGPGHDLPAALYSAVTGRSLEPSPKLTENEIVALFPQEWTRDPRSPYLQTAYLDVPWEEPGLVRYCVENSQKPRTWKPEQVLTLPTLTPVVRTGSAEASHQEP